MTNSTTTFLGKIIGARLPIKSSVWSNVYVYEPTITRVTEARGNLYLVLDLPAHYEDLGTAIIDVIREKYYHELELDPLQSLEEALSHANKKIEEYNTRLVTEKQETLKTINIACTVLCGQDLHLAQVGHIDTYLVRKGRLNKISNVSTGSTKEIQSFQNIASGKIEVGDIVTVSSPKLFDFLPINKFKEIITSCYPSVAASRISEVISKKTDADVAPSLLVLEINTDLKEQAEPVTDEPETMENGLKSRKDQIAEQLIQDADTTVSPPVVARREQVRNQPAYDAEPVFPADRKDNPLVTVLNRLYDGVMLVKDVITGKEDISKLSKLFLALGLILVLVVGAKAITGREKTNPVVETNKAFEQAWENFTSAREYLRNNDFVNAREYLLAARTRAAEAQSLGLFPEETTQLLNDIQNELDKLDGVTRLTGLTAIADTKTISETSSPVSIQATNDSYYIFDEQNQNLYQLTKDNQQLLLALDTIVEGRQVQHMTATPQKLYFYSAQGDDVQIYTYTPANQKVEAVSLAFGGTWEKASVLTSWTDSANTTRLYFIDPIKNSFWRYRPAGAQFSAGENYFETPEATPALGSIVDAEIDGNVFFLTQDGQVFKYVLGNQETEFKLRGLKVPLSSPTALYTATPDGTSDNTGKKLYVTDAGNQRVLIFSKEDGLLAKIYAADNAFTDLRDIYADEVNNYLYVLDGTKIYRFEM
ncbi:MAG TPA: hypothetical protein PKL83_05020 [bacterium]|nr:hypothetical protein [bacterium]